MEALCQVCYIEPAITIHEASQLRCCCGCSAWLSEGEAEGSQRWKEVKGYPWDTDEKLGHLFETGAQFDLPPAVASLCGVKAPVWPIGLAMDMPPALRRFGLCVACLKACPDPAGIAYRGTQLLRLRCANFAGDRPGRGNQLRRSARDSQTNFT